MLSRFSISWTHSGQHVSTIYESSGLEMAGWLAGLGAGQAGWACRQAGWSWQADLDVGPDLKLDGPASQTVISSPELSQKGKKKELILRKL